MTSEITFPNNHLLSEEDGTVPSGSGWDCLGVLCLSSLGAAVLMRRAENALPESGLSLFFSPGLKTVVEDELTKPEQAIQGHPTVGQCWSEGQLLYLCPVLLEMSCQFRQSLLQGSLKPVHR